MEMQTSYKKRNIMCQEADDHSVLTKGLEYMTYPSV